MELYSYGPSVWSSIVENETSNVVQSSSWVIELGEEETADTSAFVVPFEIGRVKSLIQESIPPAQSKVIAVASGKGGTGKTTITTNLAISLQSIGLRVLVIDADFGLANDHLLLGVETKGDIGDVLAGRKDLKDILVECPSGMYLLPGGVGSSHLSELEEHEWKTFSRELSCLEPSFDVILVDLAAGVSPQIMRFLTPAHGIILVTNPEITAMMDAYGLVKCLDSWSSHQAVEVQVILNRVKDRRDSLLAIQKLRKVVAKHLTSVKMNYLGYIPYDHYLLHSISIQEPVVLSHPRSFVTACLKGIAQKIYHQFRAWEKIQEEEAIYKSYFGLLEPKS
ncbi:MAG: AAA family ATPase [Deltaproteobacteria bacterium]|nr:AAA family ATPase [Deltaproteobacteria bacterium]